ncbi:Ldh family oxidoreductase [Salinarimonas ramus]|uniref:Malate dehydrogenase n=1 Tax=Salinarimonas ramus TaxID=690164 RepID=A0A917V2S9_9HYPH|nr:Ldh family oxidoreductase [Salinarimonas ramus]GGK26593.1 malate dehydrogenase [Salinarimonas ramus]
MSATGSEGALERVREADLAAFCREVLAFAGADLETADAATRAMLHASRLGVDSHGVRLLDHYVRVLRGGRVNGTPMLRFDRADKPVAMLDADHAHGARATYAAMERACLAARRYGIGAVGIRNSSHFGAAGAYALAAAEVGLIGLVVCNSDAFVRLHGGAERFHGTNPIAAAAPSGSGRPWLLDMATSAIPYNRIVLHRSLARPLPEGTASTESGEDTEEPDLAAMLAPLGGAFGYKGAGLAGLVEILSALLTGMGTSAELLPMTGPDLSTPRGLGAFVLAIDPQAFVGRTEFEAGMRRYVAALRGSAPAEGARVLAPGDREWEEAENRARLGIPIDPHSLEAFRRLSEELGVPPPASIQR